MTDVCQQENWQGRCCCNCKNQSVMMKHPWNKGDGKGRISEVMGYGCRPPDFEPDDKGRNNIVFFNNEHGMCELHDFRELNVKVRGDAPPYGAASLSTDGLGGSKLQRKDAAMEEMIKEPEDIVDRLRENADLDAMEHVPADIVQMQRDAIHEILRLRMALALVMETASEELQAATDADLEAALVCGDTEAARQANAWRAARAALKTPNVLS